jgi:hypothetical protein
MIHPSTSAAPVHCRPPLRWLGSYGPLGHTCTYVYIFVPRRSRTAWHRTRRLNYMREIALLSRMSKRFFSIALFALVCGVCLFGLSALATKVSFPYPGFYSSGYPFRYGGQTTDCTVPINPGFACGYSYNSAVVGLDYLFWVAVSIVALLFLDTVRARITTSHGERKDNEVVDKLHAYTSPNPR